MRLSDRATIVRAPLVVGPRGQMVRDLANATRTQNVPVEVQPVSSTEDVVSQQETVTRWRLFAGPGTDLAATDRVEFAGGTYEVDGDVERWRARGAEHHVEAVLKMVTVSG